MVKSDPAKFWVRANNIQKQLTSGKNFFETGEEYRIPYLPSKILYLYSTLSDMNFYGKDLDRIINSDSKDISKVKIGSKKLFFLIFQSFIYYGSLIFLYLKISKKYDKNICLIIIFFLSIEPSIMLFHSSFWSESIFFTLLILCLGLIIDDHFNKKKFFLLGILLGLLFLQRSVAIYYIIFILCYLTFVYKKKTIIAAPLVILGYLILVIFLGINNLKRSGVFYFEPTQAKDGLHNYLVLDILSIHKKKDKNKIKQNLDKDIQVWIAQNNINIEIEKDKLKYYDFLKKNSLKIIMDHPLTSLSIILKRTISFLVLDPARHVHYFYNLTLSENDQFYKSDLSYKWLFFRIPYSMFVYFVALAGFYCLFKKGKFGSLEYFLAASIIYFTLISSWTANTRYNTPNLIFISFFFGSGFDFICKRFFLGKR